MANILFMKDVFLTLKLGAAAAVQFNAHLASAHVEVTPGDEQTYPTLDGGVASQVGPASYHLVLRGGQDYGASGLARYLWDNDGQTVTFEYNAHGFAAVASTTTPKVTGSVKCIAGAYGGEVGTFAEIEVSLPCTAKPTLAIT